MRAGLQPGFFRGVLVKTRFSCAMVAVSCRADKTAQRCDRQRTEERIKLFHGKSAPRHAASGESTGGDRLGDWPPGLVAPLLKVIGDRASSEQFAQWRPPAAYRERRHAGPAPPVPRAYRTMLPARTAAPGSLHYC